VFGIWFVVMVGLLLRAIDRPEPVRPDAVALELGAA
jgi:hypothetical protein